MINFVCVYRTGKIYTPEYVGRLAKAIVENYEKEHTFTVLTDAPNEIPFLDDDHHDPRAVLLNHSWPSYWPKLELFRPNLFRLGELVIYFDLDVIPRKSLKWIVDRLQLRKNPLRFYMLRDWLAPDHFNSSVMCWVSGFHTHPYVEFLKNPEAYMREYRRYPEKWGDQSFITHHLGILPTPIQDEFPGDFVSFKANTTEEKCNASVVCFHGNPRPHEVHWAATAPFGES